MNRCCTNPTGELGNDSWRPHSYTLKGVTFPTTIIGTLICDVLSTMYGHNASHHSLCYLCRRQSSLLILEIFFEGSLIVEGSTQVFFYLSASICLRIVPHCCLQILSCYLNISPKDDDALQTFCVRPSLRPTSTSRWKVSQTTASLARDITAIANVHVPNGAASARHAHSVAALCDKQPAKPDAEGAGACRCASVESPCH